MHAPSPPSLRLRQRIRDAPRPARTDDLRGAFGVGGAKYRAIGAGRAFAIGAAAIALCVLRELAAGFVARALELIGRRLGQRQVARQRRVGQR